MEGCAGMFRNKEMKRQLEQTHQVQTQVQEYRRILGAVEADTVETQVEVDQLQMSASKMDRSLTKVVDYARDTREEQQKTKQDLAQMGEQLRQLDAEVQQIGQAYHVQSEFLDSQEQSLTELMEGSKRYTGLSKHVSEIAAKESEQTQRITGQIAQMRSFVGNVSTLALQAAIDAGRLGDAGSDYIHTAEQIRSLAEAFGSQMDLVMEQMQQLQESEQDLGDQLHQFIALLKENTVSLGRMAADVSEQNHSQQPQIPRTTDGIRRSVEQIQQIEQRTGQCIEMQEAIMDAMENVGSCYMEQQDSTARVEQTISHIKQMLSDTEYQNETEE